MQENFFEKEKNIEEIAGLFYDFQFEYHNFEHALKVWKYAQEIIARCIKEGKVVDEKVVYYACLFHDAGYHEDEKEKGFQSKEEYATSIAEMELAKIGVDGEMIKSVAIIIKGTEKDFDVVELPIEGMILRAADLAGFAEDYDVFLENNKKLRRETERIDKKSISWEQWKNKTEKIAEHYLSQEIKLTRYYEDENGESVFHKKTKENLARFLEEKEND